MGYIGTRLRSLSRQKFIVAADGIKDVISNDYKNIYILKLKKNAPPTTDFLSRFFIPEKI
jgi:hypothetical protein